MDGYGHVGRMVALAKALPGAKHLLLDSEPLKPLPDVEGLVYSVEAPGDGFDLCFVDLKEGHEQAVPSLRRTARILATIDDYGEPRDWADLVIDPAGRTHDSQRLVGLQYCLIDPELARNADAPAAGPVRKVLVTFGAVDSRNYTLGILEMLDSICRDAVIDVVLGSSAPHLEAVRLAAGRIGDRCRVHVDVEDMRPLLGSADLVVCAGGVTFLEALSCGRPVVVVVTNAGQRRIVDRVSEQGGAFVVGEGCDPDWFREQLASLIGDDARRSLLGKKARGLVDARGAYRVAATLERALQPSDLATQ